MTTHLDRFAGSLDFDLDGFQTAGCRAVEAGRGVLVCAPTGAGKTVVGEFAVDLALHQGTKCFYTTPIKALSNQKYADLCAVYGARNVGLLTGDRVINGDADIVVMTTEVLRNMIYAGSPALNRLSFVVLDEVHYLADASRGAVWEEVILNLDERVKIIALSATVSNSEEFGEWLRTVRGDTEVVVSDYRPVPLTQWLQVGRSIVPLFEPGPEPELSRGLNRAVSRGERERPVKRPQLIRMLAEQNMLPAITFIFSRAGCDDAQLQCLRSHLTLTTREEAHEIGRIVDAGVADIPEEDLEVLRFRQWRAGLKRGFAAHHAGMLPAFRLIVEELFQRGLVRAVFATETLALGINMPARTVVLEKLVKFNGESHVELTAAEYTQLTGRAGRRGIDTVGNAVVQWRPDTDVPAVAGLAATRTYPLVSTFSPGFNMAVNLISTLGFDRSIETLESSFAQFQADSAVVDAARALERATDRQADLRRRLENQVAMLVADQAVALDTVASDADPTELLDQVTAYVELRGKLSAAEKRSKKASAESQQKETQRLLAGLRRGDVLALPAKKRPLLATVISPANQARDPRPQVITETGWFGRIGTGDFANTPVALGRMRLPRNAGHHPKRYIRSVVEQFRHNSFGRPKKLRLRARQRPNKEVTRLREELHGHPVHSWPKNQREALARTGADVVHAHGEVERLRAAVDSSRDTLARTFRRIVDMLTELDYVERDPATGPRVTREGERLARLHNESDILVAQCLRRGVWDGLDPAELAGVASTCVFDNRRETPGQVQTPTDRLRRAIENTERIYAELVSDEQRHDLPPTREPQAEFALAIHQWTAGAPLAYTLDAAAQCGAELGVGDFVRWCRRVVDLLEQIAATGYSDGIRRRANQAIGAIQRGVVAAGN